MGALDVDELLGQFEDGVEAGHCRLHDDGDLGPSIRLEVRFGQGRQVGDAAVAIMEEDLASARGGRHPLQASECVEQGRLSTRRLTGDAKDFAASKEEVDVVTGADVSGLGDVIDAQTLDLQQDFVVGGHAVPGLSGRTLGGHAAVSSAWVGCLAAASFLAFSNLRMSFIRLVDSVGLVTSSRPKLIMVVAKPIRASARPGGMNHHH